MDERIEKWLFDVQHAIDEIDTYFEKSPKTYQHYKDNTLLKRAIERNLEIIGEAINRILKTDPEFPLTNARRIVGLRNQIIHAYDNVSDENIWAILIKHLPRLKTEVNELIR
ncbi:MAG: DUF86 domain-containing protein [Bacteroidales bacterium]|nr:DUF86 domain-containing protein [Bacteroidales bacterium]MCF8343970.1 DUF86 domain-containing protein [Bacteroidales bacterium]MCF8350899.1 DUF86 domain-containing protein [Bacteroidales bacterium]MCF8376921.1 DUF86 domain-containing protein [Bacteroidales bacterium]MCF8400810.1 DUF86 domain-containing protein [Bacteroidales bacterium]